MTLDEAIKILNVFQVEGEVECGGKLDDALRLGIEALKFCKGAKETIEGYHGMLLPGETE